MSRFSLTDSTWSLDTAKNRRFIKYLLVGAAGVGINQGILYLATGIIGLAYLIGAFLGQAVSLTVNYALNDAWTWNEYGSSGWKAWVWRGLKYGGTRVVGIVIHLITLIALVELFQIHYLIANLFAIGAGIAWGFGASDVLVWKTDHSYTLTTHLRDRWSIVDETVSRDTQHILALALVLFIGLTVYMILLYRSFWMTGGDFGSYVHAFETTREGISFMHTGRYRIGNLTSAYWGEHFTVTLFAVYPIYWLFPAQETLFIIKSASLALSIPILWIVAREHLSVRLAKFTVLAYALNPFLYSAWLFDFQEQIFLPTLILGAYYLYLKQRHKLFLLAIAAILLTNEFLVFIIGGSIFGFIAATSRSSTRSLRDEWYIFVAMAAMVVGTHLLSGYVISQYNQFTGIPVTAIAEPFRPFIETQRVSTGELVSLMLSHPLLIWESITMDMMQKSIFLVMFFVPVAFMSLFDELTITSIAPFIGFAWLFSGSEVYYMFGAHYPLYLLPFLYIGAVRVIGRLSFTTESRTLMKRIFIAILVLNVIAGLSTGIERQAVPQENDHTDTVNAAIESIPEDASLVTQNEIYPHVADRPTALFIGSSKKYQKYTTLYDVKKPEYIMFDTKINIRPENWAKEVQQAYQDQLGDEYGLYRYQDGIWIFKKGYEGKPQGITHKYRLPHKSYSATELSVGSGVLYDNKIESTHGRENEIIWFGPYESLPPGTYNVTYRVNVDSQSEDSGLRLEAVKDPNLDPLAKTNISHTDGWESITFTLTLENYTSNLEFRGMRKGNSGTIAVRNVTVEPITKTVPTNPANTNNTQR
ncbi:GtrA family protein [Salinibaculum salinum]|uniref:GtrA family protein n=1 Tax=Salinibaculum salinum TaxID=3131996 RepID=UPI0030EB6D62